MQCPTPAPSDHAAFARALVGAVPGGVAMLDRAGVTVACNDEHAALTGHAGRDLVGARYFASLKPRAFYAPLAEAFGVARKRGRPGTAYEGALYLPAAGREVRVRVALGRHEGCLFTLVSYHDAAAAPPEARDLFNTFLVHDLKTPLWAILLTLPEVRGAVGADAAAQGAIDDCLAEAQRMQAMLNDLLDVHRFRHGVMPVVRAEVDLVAVAREAARVAGPALGAAGLAISIEGPTRLVVDADGTLIRRVLDNLIGNAVRFAKREVIVDISATRPGLVRVIDDGPGVPKDLHERVFDHFARGPEGRGRGDNRGLGLTFCRLVTRAHGGDTKIVPSERGSIFVVTFGPPRARPRPQPSRIKR